MRQMVDLYYILKSQNCKQEQNASYSLLCQFKLEDFCASCMWVLKSVFNLDDEYLLCVPDKSNGEALLKEIMLGGNFGRFDERLSKFRFEEIRIKLFFEWLKHSKRLISNYLMDVLWTPVGIL